ncbi:MAG: AAA family ATPase, partial [Gammaproteobacteria bacterium]
ENIDPDDRIYIEEILSEKIDQIALESSIKRLLRILYQYHKQKPILLVDEYDTPIQEAYLQGYYEQLISFFRNFLSEPLKDSNLLNRAILTGILRISKESLFSGLSNVKVYSLLDQNYCSYFGFTEIEVNELLSKAKLLYNINQTKEWYNGYNFGGMLIYNPWSIINFIKDEGKRLKSYWINTSGNELVKNIIIKSSFNVQEKIADLIAGKTIKEYIDENIVFTDLEQSNDAIWGLLLMAGYLKYVSYEDHGRRSLCELGLPNNEVEDYYTSVVEEWITGDRGFNWYIDFINDLKDCKVVEFEQKLQTLIEETLSFHDVTKKSQESFYHGLMLAFITGLKKTHFISSNKESGSGRYDIAIIPKDNNKLVILIELKAVDNKLKLEEVAKKALIQIKESNYFMELKSRGITKICSLGISFSGKAIKIVSDLM